MKKEKGICDNPFTLDLKHFFSLFTMVTAVILLVRAIWVEIVDNASLETSGRKPSMTIGAKKVYNNALANEK